MDHQTASRLLTECGRLDPGQLRALGAHLTTCGECRGWVATYEFFAESLAETPAAARHLGSDELCAFALESGDLDGATRSRCRAHVESCSECRQEVELVRSAVSESSENVVREWPLAGLAEGLFDRPGVLALAATVVVLLGGLLVVGLIWSPKPKELHLAGQQIRATEVVEAQAPIFVVSTHIRKGGSLALRSRAVTFGHGFSVDSGASLIVGEGGIAPRGGTIDNSTNELELNKLEENPR